MTRTPFIVVPDKPFTPSSEAPPDVAINADGRSFQAVGNFALVGLAFILDLIALPEGALVGSRVHPLRCFLGEEEKYEDGLFILPVFVGFGITACTLTLQPAHR